MSATDTKPVAAEQIFARAQQTLSGGVSASMRLHPYIGRPLYVERGEGPYLYGVDGKRYIDFNMSNGAALLGHDHPAVKRAVIDPFAAQRGTAFAEMYADLMRATRFQPAFDQRVSPE